MSFVLDASVALRWLLDDGTPQMRAYALRVSEALESESAIVPVMWGLEIANVIARTEAKNIVSEAESKTFISMLLAADIRVDAATCEHALFATLDIARRFKLSAYDASYLELALRLGMPIATLDEDLMKAAKQTGVRRFD
jgi:predicted nucleic acid-binding protein